MKYTLSYLPSPWFILLPPENATQNGWVPLLNGLVCAGCVCVREKILKKEVKAISFSSALLIKTVPASFSEVPLSHWSVLLPAPFSEGISFWRCCHGAGGQESLFLSDSCVGLSLSNLLSSFCQFYKIVSWNMPCLFFWSINFFVSFLASQCSGKAMALLSWIN